MALRARFYDGLASAPASVAIDLSPDGLLTIDDEAAGPRTYPVATLHVHDRVGLGAPRSIELPGGGLLHVPPDPGFDALLDRLTRADRGWVRLLESRWSYAIAALLLVLASAAAFVGYGVPALARVAAESISPRVERQIGQMALAEFDARMLGPSGLAAERQAQLRRLFDRGIAGQVETVTPPTLQFRAGRLVGANALALPGGIIVLTDELVALSRLDDEILMVLAHETGHVISRDSLEQLFQGLGTTLVIAFLTGDPSSPASLAAAAPAVMIQAGYSRADEREADRYAFAWADAHAIPRTRLTDLLSRIEESGGVGQLPTFLSTHPSTAERIQLAAEVDADTNGSN